MVYGDDRFYLCVEVLRILCDSFYGRHCQCFAISLRKRKACGAKAHQLVTKITIPMIAPTTFFVFLMELIYSFKIFREVFALFGDYPNTNVYFLQNFINNNYYNLNYPRLSAASIVLSLFIIIVLFIFFCFERKHSYS